MTMERMNKYLEEKGFDVLRERDSKRDLYIFTISRPGCGSFTKEFKYPSTNDPKHRDLQMREFLDGMVRDFYKSPKTSSADPYETLQRAILNRDTVELRIGNISIPTKIHYCNVKTGELPTIEGVIDIDNSFEYKEINPAALIDYCKTDVTITRDLYTSLSDCTPTGNLRYIPAILDVIYNDPATIVFWGDGTKTVVKCQPEDKYDAEKGLAMAISKKALGNQDNYYNTFEKWPPEPEAETDNDTLNMQDYIKAVNTLANNFRKRIDELEKLCGTPDDALDEPKSKENRIFRTRYEAEEAIDELLESARTYSFATLADWKEICDLDADFTMAKRGWTFECLLHNMPKAMRTRDGYEVALPRPYDLGFSSDYDVNE